MKRDYGIPCIEIVPGAPLQEVSKEYRNQGPPEGFIDNTVYRYRLKPDGTKEFIGTMPAFPEGWNDSMKLKEKRLKGVEKMVRPKREAPPAEELRLLWEKHEGKINPIAKELRTSWAQARQWLIEAGIINSSAELIGMGQTPDPEPAAQVGSQEPEREEVESATQSVAQEEPEITVKDVLMCEAAQREQGFGPEDDEPIPYTVAASRTWTDEAKEQARKLKAEGLTMRQIAEEIGFTYRQVKGFFERERKKQRKPNQNDVLSKYKVKWIRDVMLDDLDPGVQLQIVAAVQGMEI